MASTTILSDNGVSSGSAGYKITAGNDGVLILQTTTSGGTATNALAIDTSQNVGVGTSSPATRLHVEGANVISTVKASSGFSAQILNAATSNVSLVGFQVNSTDVARIIADSGPSLQFCTGSSNTERMRINANSAILCLQGGSTSATGTGIAFPATQSASSDVNTLDDYEEGTFTPVFLVNGSQTNVTQLNQFAQYIKIGKLVYINLVVGAGYSGASTANVSLSGLPFTNGAGYDANMAIAYSSGTWSATPRGGYMAAGGTSMALVTSNSSNYTTGYLNTGIQGTQLGAGGYFQASFCYQASS